MAVHKYLGTINETLGEWTVNSLTIPHTGKVGYDDIDVNFPTILYFAKKTHQYCIYCHDLFLAQKSKRKLSMYFKGIIFLWTSESEKFKVLSIIWNLLENVPHKEIVEARTLLRATMYPLMSKKKKEKDNGALISRFRVPCK